MPASPSWSTHPKLTMWITAVTAHNIFRQVMAAATLIALLAVVSAGMDTAHAQQVDDSLPPLADLTIASEYDTRLILQPAWAVTVKNETVGAHPGMHVSLVKVRFTISDPVRGETTSIWTIRDLPPGGSMLGGTQSLLTEPAATDGPEKVPQRFYAEIIESDPVELPRFQFNNATEHWAIENRREVPHAGSNVAGVNRYTNGDIAIDVVGISDRLPRQPGATTFTVAARNDLDGNRIPSIGASFQDHTLFDVRVEISLSPGLSFAANQPAPPSGVAVPDGTTFDTTTGIWNIGTLLYAAASANPSLQVAVNLTADSLADLPLEERCLTAKVVNAVPWFANDPLKRQNNTATACLGKELLSSGTMDLIDFYPCINDTSTPCTSTGTLELVVARSVGDQIEFRQPESVIVHVPDPRGRFSKNGSLVWSTVNLMDMRNSWTRLTSSWSVKQSAKVTAPGGGDAPGRWLLTDPDDSANTFDLLDAMDSSTVTFGFFDLSDAGNDPAHYYLEAKVDFWALGTYKALLGIYGRLSGTTHTDSGTYIFHVGPVADLAVRDAGASSMGPAGQRAFSIVAVNHGPDHAPDVRVTGLPRGATALFDSEDGYDAASGVWTIGELKVGTISRQASGMTPFPTLTLAATSTTPITATIENAEDYCVRIKDASIDWVNDRECAGSLPAGYTEHTAAYYDYYEGNNTATIKPRAVETGPEALRGLRAHFYQPDTAIVRWTEVPSVNLHPVSHYELWKSTDVGGGTCRAPEKEQAGTLRILGTVYVDHNVDPMYKTCYNVRAVNDWDVPGYWSEQVIVTRLEPESPQISVEAGPDVGEGEGATFTFRASPAPIAGEILLVSYTVADRRVDLDTGGYVDAAHEGPGTIELDNRGVATISVQTQADALDRPDGEVTVALTEGDGYTLGSARSASVAVLDDDNPSVSFAASPSDPLSEGNYTHDVIINIDPPSHTPLDIYYSVGGDVADEGERFSIAGSGLERKVTAGSGSSQEEISVRLIDDDKTLEDTVLNLALSPRHYYDLASPVSYTLTIIEDDGPRAEFATSTSVVDEDVASPDNPHEVVVNLNPTQPDTDVTIYYSLSGSTATRDTDFGVGDETTVTASAGAASVAIPVTIMDDHIADGDETVVLMLSRRDAYTLGDDRKHTLTIRDNDLSRASFDATTVSRGEGHGVHNARVNLSPPAPEGGLTLRYDVTGDASRNRDYRVPGTVTVEAGVDRVNIPVEISDDGDNEADETVILTLRSGRGYAVDDPDTHTLTIQDDDPTLSSFEEAEASVSETAGGHRVVINLDPPPHKEIAIEYMVGGSAEAGADYDYTIPGLSSGSGSVTARRGDSRVQIPLRIVNDDANEGDETLVLTLNTGSGYVLGEPGKHTLTITDDDAPVIAFKTESGEPSEGDGAHSVIVRLDAVASSPVTVGIEVSAPDGPLGADSNDYSGIPNNVTIPAGLLETEIEITITDDPDNEADERLKLTLESGGAGYSLSQSKPTEYRLIIVDDDNDGYPVAQLADPAVDFGPDPESFEMHEGHSRYAGFYLIGEPVTTVGDPYPNDGVDLILEYFGGTADMPEDCRILWVRKYVHSDGNVYETHDQYDIDGTGGTGVVAGFPHPANPGDVFTARAYTVNSNGYTRFLLSCNDDGKNEGTETLIFRLVNGPGYHVKGPTDKTVFIRD